MVLSIWKQENLLMHGSRWCPFYKCSFTLIRFCERFLIRFAISSWRHATAHCFLLLQVLRRLKSFKLNCICIYYDKKMLYVAQKSNFILRHSYTILILKYPYHTISESRVTSISQRQLLGLYPQVKSYSNNNWVFVSMMKYQAFQQYRCCSWMTLRKAVFSTQCPLAVIL